MTKPPPINAAGPLPLLCVLALALALRVWGITWGLPSATHYFSYHPDESVVLETSSLTMNVFAGRLLPHYYHYGSLQFYLVCFANTLAALSGAVDIVPKNFAVWYPQWAKMYLIGRCLTVGMGVGTVWATYAVGARLWGRRVGLVAASFLTVMPLHAQQSHFLTVDVPATFWVMLSLLWSVRLATNDPKPLRAALFAGLFAGLAAATKYNMALAILPLLMAACLVEPTPPRSSASPPEAGRVRDSEKRSSEKGGFQNSSPSRFGRVAARCGVGFLSYVLAFFAACPGALLESNVFLKDFRFESVHVQNQDDPTFRDTGNGFVYHITHNLDAGLGLPLLVLALVSVGYALYRRQRGDALLAVFALPYYVLISLAAVRYARYTIPLLPILALWVGRMLAEGSRLPRVTAQRAALVGGALAAAWTFIAAAGLILPMIDDPRDRVLWRIERIDWPFKYPPEPERVKSVGFAVQPWFGDVPVSPYFSYYRPGAWRSATAPKTLARILYSGKDWDTDALQRQKPDLVALSEYDYDDALRLKDPSAMSYLAALTRDYYRVGIAPESFWRTPGFPSENLPHDMTYTCPAISLYQRKN